MSCAAGGWLPWKLGFRAERRTRKCRDAARKGRARPAKSTVWSRHRVDWGAETLRTVGWRFGGRRVPRWGGVDCEKSAQTRRAAWLEAHQSND